MELKKISDEQMNTMNSILLNEHANVNAPEVEKEIVGRFFSTSYNVVEKMKKETQEVINSFNEVSGLFKERKNQKFSFKKLIGINNKELEEEIEENFQQKFIILKNLIHKYPERVEIYEEDISQVKKILLEYSDQTNNRNPKQLSEEDRIANTLNSSSMLSVITFLESLKNSAYYVKNTGMTSFVFMDTELMQEKLFSDIDKGVNIKVTKSDLSMIDNIRKQYDHVLNANDGLEVKKLKK